MSDQIPATELLDQADQIINTDRLDRIRALLRAYDGRPNPHAVTVLVDKLWSVLDGTVPVPGSSQRAQQPAGVLAEVAAERRKQDAKWGEQNHPDGTGPDVRIRLSDTKLMAELAQMMRDQCQLDAKRGQTTWLRVQLEEVFEALAEDDPAKLRAELVQVAAVAVAWIEAIDRREPAALEPMRGPVDGTPHETAADASTPVWLRGLTARHGEPKHKTTDLLRRWTWGSGDDERGVEIWPSVPSVDAWSPTRAAELRTAGDAPTDADISAVVALAGLDDRPEVSHG